MLGKRAIELYRMGYNCSQCIVKAYCDIFGEEDADRLLDMCGGIYGGLGIGSICCVYTGCIMVLGLHCRDNELKQKKALFCFGFSELFGSGSCTLIKEKYGCEQVITGASALLEELISPSKEN